MADPFGEAPEPWWRRMWRRERSASAPKGYAFAAGGVGSIAAFSLAQVPGIDHGAKVVLCALVTGLPPLLLETWWKPRHRRAAEQLFVLPRSSGPGRVQRGIL